MYIEFVNYTFPSNFFWYVNGTVRCNSFNTDVISVLKVNVIIDGDFYASEIDLQDGIIWLDGKFIGGHVETMRLLLAEPGTSFFVINDTVYSEYPKLRPIRPLNSNLHFAFATKVTSISYGGSYVVDENFLCMMTG